MFVDTLANETVPPLPPGPPTDGIAPERHRRLLTTSLFTEIPVLNGKGLGRILSGASGHSWAGA